MSNYFKNLAMSITHHPSDKQGEVLRRLDNQVKEELLQAKIEIHEYSCFRYFDKDSFKEVPTAIVGILNNWKFDRRWRYWAVEGPGLSLEDAMPLFFQHGEDCRAYGHAGGENPLQLGKGDSVDVYHVDSQEALNALVHALQKSHLDAYIKYGYTLHKTIV